jgi:hypothetical protein
MFLDGMGDQLSGLQEKDQAGEGDHAQGDPLNGIEEVGVGEGLAQEGEEELGCAGGREGEGEGVARAMAARKLTEKCKREKCGEDCGVESNGVEADGTGWDGYSPRKGSGEAGVGALGEVAEGEEGPDEGGAGGPGVEGVEERQVAGAEVDCCGEDGEKDAAGGEGGYHEQKDRVGEEVVEIGSDQQKAGEREGGEKSEEAGVPELVRD